MKVVLTIPVSPFAGYGRDGIGLAQALIRAGVDVYLRPTVLQAPIPQDIANLFTKELEAPFDLSITHIDPMALNLAPDLKAATAMNIGWTMWEFQDTSHMPRRSSLKSRLKDFDAMVFYDEVSKSSLSPYVSKKTAIIKQQGGSDFDMWQPVERDWDSENFYFGIIGAPLTMRKNPHAFVQAFSELKNEHEDFDKYAKGLMKTSPGDPNLHPAMEDVYPGLRIIAETWGYDALRTWYENLHCLVAPSRGEGKHLPSLEFQATGGPVIATNWGGMAEWLNPEYSYPINNYTIESMDPYNGGYISANVDVQELKAHMLHVFRNRGDAKAKGTLASKVIPEMCSWDAVVLKLMTQLRDNVEGGDELWDKFGEVYTGA